MKSPINILILCISLIVLFNIVFLDVYASESYIAYVPFNSKTLMSDDGNIEYYHHDYLGNVVVKTDDEADIVWEADYEPFGDTFNEQGNSDFRFTGKELDETGLHYFGARYYDKDTGRFITADSVEGNIEKPQTLNRYSYSINNPLRYNDPDGRQVKDSNEDNENNPRFNQALGQDSVLFQEYYNFKGNFLSIFTEQTVELVTLGAYSSRADSIHQTGAMGVLPYDLLNLVLFNSDQDPGNYKFSIRTGKVGETGISYTWDEEKQIGIRHYGIEKKISLPIKESINVDVNIQMYRDLFFHNKNDLYMKPKNWDIINNPKSSDELQEYMEQKVEELDQN